MLALAGLLVVAVVVWRATVAWPHLQQPRVGDGENIDSYGFDLSTLRVERALIAAWGQPKDGLPALVNPPAASVEQMSNVYLGRNRFLVSGERAIGVEVNGEARAYPLRILVWHEVVNDTLGGVPIVVTYNPLSHTAAAYDRRLDGETLEFGVSGLLYNSTLLMYDRRPGSRGESLWSQLLGRAIAGPAAAQERELKRLPLTLGRWAEWHTRYPQTTVLRPERAKMSLYRLELDTPYFSSQQADFPVAARPPDDRVEGRTPCIGLRAGGEWYVYSIARVAGRVDAGGSWTTRVGERDVRLRLADSPPSAWAEPLDASPLEVAYADWFIWYAHYPAIVLKP